MRFDLRRHQTCFEARFPDQPFKLRLRLPRTAPLFTTPYNSSLCLVDVGRTDTSVEELNKATSAPLLTNLSPALRCKGLFKNNFSKTIPVSEPSGSQTGKGWLELRVQNKFRGYSNSEISSVEPDADVSALSVAG